MCQRFIIGVVEIHNDQLSGLIFMLLLFFFFPGAGGAEQHRSQRWTHQGGGSDSTGASFHFISVATAGLNNKGIWTDAASTTSVFRPSIQWLEDIFYINQIYIFFLKNTCRFLFFALNKCHDRSSKPFPKAVFQDLPSGSCSQSQHMYI